MVSVPCQKNYQMKNPQSLSEEDLVAQRRDLNHHSHHPYDRSSIGSYYHCHDQRMGPKNVYHRFYLHAQGNPLLRGY
uniref:Uncharacterized protein n=1 Tax=Arundo donax TaxID=35708 RepID=A0A0A9D2X3_ARUDO